MTPSSPKLIPSPPPPSDGYSPSDGQRPSLDKVSSNTEVNSVRIIRVPTKELAEFALKAAFDRGYYDIQVIIE